MKEFTPAPILRPRHCVGGLLDIPAGRYHEGKYGDMILNGGFSNFMGFGGRGNTFKTTLALGIGFIVLARYDQTSLTVYDTEITFAWDRLEDMASRHPGLSYDGLVEEKRLLLTSGGEYSGNEWWDIIRTRSKERAKAMRGISVETPFVTKDGSPIKIAPTEIHFLDSMSNLETDAVSDIYDKNQIDAGAANTDALRGAAIKTRLVMQVPSVTSQGGMSLMATAHVGDELKLDPYAPAKQQLAFLKKGLKFKNVPEKFTFLSSNTWYIADASPLVNQSTKAAEYPLDGFNNMTGDTDLQELTLINVRSKSGPTGHILTLVVSQTEGLLPHLSEFHYLKKRKDKFGLLGPEGINKSYRVALYPEVLLQRTKLRGMIDEDAKLQRALEITTEMCQIYDHWPDFPSSHKVDPEDLYKKLSDMGYDWDILLSTRGYWTFDHYKHPVNPLSTMDLINMYHGIYIPFWYPNKDKLKLEKKESKQ